MILYDICKDSYSNNIDSSIPGAVLRDIKKRKEHSLSVCYIGRYILSKFANQLLIPVNSSGSKLFSLDILWEYLSIYHDIGYDYQDIDKYNYNRIEKEYCCTILDINDNENKLWLNEIKFNDLMAYYLINMLDPYDKKEPCEHGILGSYLFHKQYYNKRPKQYRNLQSWNDVVLGISLTMAQHNIWPIREETLNKNNIDLNVLHCTKDSNGKFILFGHEPFSYGKSFLPFYLCLIDTIEPIKLFYKHETNELDSNKAESFLKVIDVNVVAKE